MNILIFIISINGIFGKKNLMGHHESGFAIRSVADEQSISVGIFYSGESLVRASQPRIN